jgi:hypothetical protein
MNSPVKNLLQFLCASVFVILMAVALNFVVDPLQLFRPAHFYHPMYSTDSRMQNAGLIRSQDFDTVFMGTSLAIHFRQSDIDRLLGVRSLKLAMTGSNSHEQSFVLAAALERHPKRVIWQMDDWIFRDAPDIDRDAYLPGDLYRRNAKGIAGYLLSGAMARESLWMLARSVKPLEKTVARLTSGIPIKFPIPNADEINILWPDFDLSTAYNSTNARASFAHYLKFPDEIRAGYDYEAMVRNFERDAVSLIKNNTGVEFRIYFPPYSILQFVIMREKAPDTLQTVNKFSAYVFDRLLQLPNVEVYDFRDASEITHDLTNYLDTVHHSPAIDLKVLSYMAAGNHLVSRDAPTASIERLKKQVEGYRLDQIQP